MLIRPRMLARALAVGALLGSAAPAALAEVIFTQQSNSIFAADLCADGSGICSSSNSATGVGYYGDSVRYEQTSAVETDNFPTGDQVFYHANSLTRTSTGSGSALFSLQFEVVGTPEPFSLLASNSYRPGAGDSSVSLTGPSGFSVSETYQGTDQNGIVYYVVDASGILPVGTYTLSEELHTGSPGTPGYSFSAADANLTVVPLPGSLWLLLSGGIALMIASLRGRQQVSHVRIFQLQDRECSRGSRGTRGDRDRHGRDRPDSYGTIRCWNSI